VRLTKIVTSFIRDGRRLLILKRSGQVKSMRGLWAGISGVIEENEEPLRRAKVEIFEEVGIAEKDVTLVRAAQEIMVSLPQHKDHEWEIFPFLFEAKDPVIRLNWENSEFRWIDADELEGYETVPGLQRVLLSLL